MKFSIATFNVENLITAEKPIYKDTRPRYTQEQYTLKVAWVREQLLKMDAEVIGFQEVFEEQALLDCIAGTRYENAHIFVAKPNGIRPVNAILSTFPIVNARLVEEIPSEFLFFDEEKIEQVLESTRIPIPIKRFSRGVLRAELQVSNTLSVLVYVLHLKSKRPILPEDLDRDEATYTDIAKGSIRSLLRRGVEACGVRQLLSDDISLNEDRPIFVLGDLNDSDTAVTNQAITGEPPYHRLPDDVRFDKWKYVFHNCKYIQARKSIENYHYTYIHNGHYESLDNIFVSNHFADLNKSKTGRIMDVRLYNDHIIDKTISMDKKPFHVSDHGQVVANIHLFDNNMTPY
ncbi:endonuclease/exonuclease/phosphatase family protein [Pontibacter diazotrophicus]|uniref:Endonuclease/exonuclease/phosphatase family protein n=1 Tax=Pontibacter diazotrophicus TaxID=1400979 RepID=A0A3D8LI83_9BACT|nr:endonuclease/exonuclease/phosphatase family protein [Pontibacter diazotrophicus]RDV17159.1 endonuclease/exonuclease/phosphatase family protein [Pontibacter diazotrophicus]